MKQKNKVSVAVMEYGATIFNAEIDISALPRVGEAINWVNDKGKRAVGLIERIEDFRTFTEGNQHSSEYRIEIKPEHDEPESSGLAGSASYPFPKFEVDRNTPDEKIF